jgi:hypothetical protein
MTLETVLAYVCICVEVHTNRTFSLSKVAAASLTASSVVSRSDAKGPLCFLRLSIYCL